VGKQITQRSRPGQGGRKKRSSKFPGLDYAAEGGEVGVSLPEHHITYNSDWRGRMRTPTITKDRSGGKSQRKKNLLNRRSPATKWVTGTNLSQASGNGREIGKIGKVRSRQEDGRMLKKELTRRTNGSIDPADCEHP